MPRSDPESGRYSRQIDLPEIGSRGQRKLAAASILVVGAGGIGSSLLMSLAGAGIGRIAICESDDVSLDNLNRQYLYRPQDIGKPKLTKALELLRKFQPEIFWQSVPGRMDLITARKICPEYDLVLAAVDNIDTRSDLNLACCEWRKPYIDAGVRGFSGYVLPIVPGQTACYSCFTGVSDNGRNSTNKNVPPGVIGAAAGVIGSLQACLAIRMLLGMEYPAAGNYYYFSGTKATIRQIALQRSPQCPACGYIKE